MRIVVLLAVMGGLGALVMMIYESTTSDPEHTPQVDYVTKGASKAKLVEPPNPFAPPEPVNLAKSDKPTKPVFVKPEYVGAQAFPGCRLTQVQARHDADPSETYAGKCDGDRYVAHSEKTFNGESRDYCAARDTSGSYFMRDDKYYFLEGNYAPNACEYYERVPDASVVHINYGRGRDAQVVRLVDRPTYLDDQAAFQKQLQYTKAGYDVLLRQYERDLEAWQKSQGSGHQQTDMPSSSQGATRDR